VSNDHFASMLRHPELVSGSIYQDSSALAERWMLKQVEHDDKTPTGLLSAALFVRKWRQSQLHRKVGPMRIDVIDKIDLPRTMPVFQLLFPRYCAGHIAQHFKMNQPVHAIFGGKSVSMFIAMLIHALNKIGRNANIDRTVMSARQHIDAGLLALSHLSSDALKWTLKQVQGDGIFDFTVLAQPNLKNQRHPELVSGSIGRFTLPDGRQPQTRRQIGPMRIDIVDKIDFPRTMPVFQLLFAGYGTSHVAQHLKMDKPVHAIFGGKSVSMFIAMLIHALNEIGRHANIDRAVISARQHIDAGLLFFSHRGGDALKWTLKQVQGDGFFDFTVLAQPNLKNQRHPELVSGSIYQLKSAALLEERHS
jgi:hypothetical protein